MFHFADGGLQWAIFDKYDFWICVVSIIFMEWVHYLERHNKMRHFFNDRPLVFRWVMYIGILWAIWIYGVFGAREFIYFTF